MRAGTARPYPVVDGRSSAPAQSCEPLRRWRRTRHVLIAGLATGLLLPMVIAAAASASAGTPAAATGTAPPWPGTSYFHYGNHSRFIKQFQDQMHARGFFPVGTGDFGPNTLAVVKRLQSLNGLTANGEIGPNTWRLAWTGRYWAAGSPSTDTSAPPWPGTPYFHYGDHSPVIKRFQDQMHARGFFPVGTGDFGPNTLAVVKRLQNLNGLIPNGEIGPNTWRLAWTGTYTITSPCKSSSCNVAGYVNPFAAGSWIPERTDQGTDWGAIRPQPVVAIGDAVITYSNSHQQGWPAGKFLVYRLTNGSHAGLYIFVAENLTNLRPLGAKVKAGQPVATAVPGGPDIEMGYAAPPGTGPNVATPYNGAPDGTQTPGGKAFARFLIELGAHPQQDPGPGPDRPY
jgi:peptidoglycan hydrolase-like protein with peptidoglycan-binding domain